MAPSARRRRSSPSLRKERTHKHLPPTTCRRTTGSTTSPNQLRGHWGAMKAAISVVHKRENGGASFKLRNTNEAPRCKQRRCNLHLAGHRTQQPRPSRGENRIALGQFRCQRHRHFNRTRRFGGPTRCCHLLVFVGPGDASFGPASIAPSCKARLRRRLANVDAVIVVLRRLGVVLRARRWSKRRRQSWR